MKLDRENFRWDISDAEIAELKALFPRVDVRYELMDMLRWISGAGKKGQKKNWCAFVKRWLRKAERDVIYGRKRARVPAPPPRAGQYEEAIRVRVV